MYQEPTNYENCDMFVEIWLSKPTDVRTDEYAVHRSFIITSRRHGTTEVLTTGIRNRKLATGVHAMHVRRVD